MAKSVGLLAADFCAIRIVGTFAFCVARRGKGKRFAHTPLVTMRTEWYRANLLPSCSNPQPFFPQNRRLMLGHERRSKVLAKLTNARCELEDALNLSTPAARYDPIVIPEPARNRLSAMIDDLQGVLRQIEGSQ
jgi:hypothetical protein